MDYRVKITPSIDYTNKIITMEQECAGQITRFILDTKDNMTRECLIKLGWTPPPTTENDENSWRFVEGD